VFTGWLDASGRIHYPGETITVTGDVTLTAKYTTLDKFVVYNYHINYPAGSKDSAGNAITDPGNLKQYVGQGQNFPALSYAAYSPTPEPEGYRFAGWATSEADAAVGTVTYQGGVRYDAPTSSELRIDIDVWAVWTNFLTVTFDAGGTYGNLTSGGAKVTYQVPLNGTLKGNAGLSDVPAVTTKDNYTFVGWALEDDWPQTTTVDINAPVTKSATYTAVYISPWDPSPSGTYFGVTFDTGDYGNLTAGGTTASYLVPAGKSLGASDGAGLSNTPAVTAKSGYTFVGWALEDAPAIPPADILAATVTAPVTYNALYAGVPTPPTPPVTIGVTFDAGGIYGNLSVGGGASVTYDVPQNGTLNANAGLSATPSVTVKPGYEFIGWALESAWPETTPNATILTAPVTEAITYQAVYAAESDPLVGGRGIAVIFDAGGIYGNIASGGSHVTYQVPEGETLKTGAGLSYVPSVKANTDYVFIGWVPADAQDQMANDDILNAKVTEPITYHAIYGAESPAVAEYFYSVIFDAGGVYGTISTDGGATTDGTISTNTAVKANTSLDSVPGFSVPSVKTTGPDVSFIGWSPVVDIVSPVTSVRVYTAQYAYTPSPSAQTLYSVRFELGEEGTYKNIPMTNYAVPAGQSLSDLKGAGGSPIFNAANFNLSNITVAENFEFIGWSPVVDPTMPVYADIVYRAQYAYMPPGLPHIDYTTLIVTEDPPNNEDIQVLGYDGYYDGIAHGIRYDTSEYTLLSGVLSFWLNPAATSRAGGGTWMLGLPPDETDVINEEIDLVFTADGKLPRSQEPIVERSIIIRPRPLVPTALHANIKVGDDVPLRASYNLNIGYDGEKRDGSLIGDIFDFSAHQSEFAKNTVALSTTYQKGDPAGDYPIYAKADVYGNYEIYEGTEGTWPYFAGWRFAGVLHVSGDPGGGNPPAAGETGGSPETSDSFNPFMWIMALLMSLAALTVLVAVRRHGWNAVYTNGVDKFTVALGAIKRHGWDAVYNNGVDKFTVALGAIKRRGRNMRKYFRN
ncbi:MAG: InlB B-repeat-containing protein, partial [Clostridiales Family XIII bacterium]|nr:InlB B-repeat-containing protein [Clostridiales Family XIII bacterium]